MTTSEVKFKREKIDGSYVYVHRLANGATIHTNQKRTNYDAFDADGHWLGFGSLEQMLICAEHGWHTIPNADNGCQLDLWELWQTHVNGGSRVLEDKESGKQFIFLEDGETVISAERRNGWNLEITNINDLYQTYGHESSGPNDSILCLVVAKQPFNVE